MNLLSARYESKTAVPSTIDLRSGQKINPWPTSFASGKAKINVDDLREDISWIRGPGGERILSYIASLVCEVR